MSTGADDEQLAEHLGTDGPADTTQGLHVEAERDRAGQRPAHRVQAVQAEEDEAAREEIEQGGG
jgi:hypothetical protein